MGRILGLDIGDQWTGIAISDPSRLIAKPYTTVATLALEEFLEKIIQKESLNFIVVGYPQTMKGTESAQTLKVKDFFSNLQKTFPAVNFILWDERLSSKRAHSPQKGFAKEDKLKEHARAAAYILDSYLTFLQHRASA
jgi:putative Holliday junction resolvase